MVHLRDVWIDNLVRYALTDSKFEFTDERISLQVVFHNRLSPYSLRDHTKQACIET